MQDTLKKFLLGFFKGIIFLFIFESAVNIKVNDMLENYDLLEGKKTQRKFMFFSFLDS